MYLHCFIRDFSNKNIIITGLRNPQVPGGLHQMERPGGCDRYLSCGDIFEVSFCNAVEGKEKDEVYDGSEDEGRGMVMAMLPIFR